MVLPIFQTNFSTLTGFTGARKGTGRQKELEGASTMSDEMPEGTTEHSADGE